MITGYADWVGQWAAVAPERVAVRDLTTGRSVRYGELSERGWRAMRALESVGVQPGDRVSLLARNGAAAFEILVACLRLGAAYTPLNWRLAPAELGGILDHAGSRVLIYDAHFASVAAGLLASRPGVSGIALGEPARGTDGSWELLLSQASGLVPADGGVAHPAEAMAMLLYTSGTTGRPKGVIVPHRQLLFNALNTVYATDLSADDRVLASLPLFHTGGLNCLATPALYRGATILLMDQFDAPAALQIIERERATVAVAVPTMWQMLLDAGLDRHDCSSLGTLLCGGAPCPETLLSAWLDRGFNFRQGFGMTEVGPNCFSLPAWMTRRKRGSVGQPVLHAAAAVFAEDGRRCEAGEVGELRLGGPHVCAGYWNDPEATAASYKDGWWHTGDLARVDGDGFFWVAGRKKDMFISGGENVYPAEIESVLAACPGVAEVAIVGVPDARWGEVGAAAVVVRAGARLDGELLRAYCAERLAKFKVPKRFELVAELPKNPSGKVLKNAVRELLVAAAPKA